MSLCAHTLKNIFLFVQSCLMRLSSGLIFFFLSASIV